jgi:hypothetical protein
MFRRVASALLLVLVVGIVGGCSGYQSMPTIQGNVDPLTSAKWVCNDGKAFRMDDYDTPWKAFYVGHADKKGVVAWDAHPWAIVRYDKDGKFSEAWISWNADGHVDSHVRSLDAFYQAIGGKEQTVCDLTTQVDSHRH